MCQKQVDTVPVKSRELKWHPCIVRVHPGACAGAWEQETHAECQGNDASSPESAKRTKSKRQFWVLTTTSFTLHGFYIWIMLSVIVYCLKMWKCDLSSLGDAIKLHLFTVAVSPRCVVFWSINRLFSTLETHPQSLRLLKIASPSPVCLHYEL